MLWKKPWEPEALLGLGIGILVAIVFGGVALTLLHAAGVHGFRTDESVGSVLIGTLSFHGVAIVLGAFFLKSQGTSLREVLGSTDWRRCLVLAIAVLVVATPVMVVLKIGSEWAMAKMHWPTENQKAVELVMGARPWLRAYLVVFTVAIAPVAEEFVFRGVLFSTAKRLGWPKLGWVGVSLLFALIHVNAPTFLSLFVLALGLTWLSVKTEGLLAPIMAHSLFNLVNIVLLVLAERYGWM